MKPAELIGRRLANQHLVASSLKTPAEVVATQGAVQAQDFSGALWGLGVRLPTTTEAEVEKSFIDGSILRFHVLRPTWHFVTPADVRWILALTAPRVHALSANMYHQLGIDAPTIKRTLKIIEKSLSGKRTLTRTELGEELAKSGVAIGEGDGMRLGYLMFYAELEALITSGPRRGKQFTYALLDERAPQAKAKTRDEALAELTRRYFNTRGPATPKDFAWWSGLTVADARAGLRLIDGQLEHEIINGNENWFSNARSPVKNISKAAYLLPNYDEYGIGYVDRSPIHDVDAFKHLKIRNRPILSHILVINGRSIGTWKRELKKDEVHITYSLFNPISKAETVLLKAAAKRYAKFLGLKPVVSSA